MGNLQNLNVVDVAEYLSLEQTYFLKNDTLKSSCGLHTRCNVWVYTCTFNKAFRKNMKNINSQEYWNNIWEKEGITTWRRYPKCYKIVNEIIGSGKSVLDCGCGVGILLKQLKEKGNEVVGIDISSSAILTIKRDFAIPGICARIPPIPRSALYFLQNSDKFDFIVATEFLEHFHFPEKVLTEFIKYADRLIISVPNNSLDNSSCIEHYQKFTEQSLRELLLKYYNQVQILPIVDIFFVYARTLIAYCSNLKDDSFVLKHCEEKQL